MDFDEQELSTLINALDVARERFKANAKVARKCGHERIAEQFERQIDQTVRLRVRIGAETGY